MTFELRITRRLLGRLHADLSRAHPYAHERVAFLASRPAPLRAGAIVLLGQDLHSVANDDYERDDTVGAMLGPGAFRQALEVAYNSPVSVFHAHRHEHRGLPWFSDVDLHEARRYVPDFWKVRPAFPHGILVLSEDSAAGLVWAPATQTPTRLARISVIGAPLEELKHEG